MLKAWLRWLMLNNKRNFADDLKKPCQIPSLIIAAKQDPEVDRTTVDI